MSSLIGMAFKRILRRKKTMKLSQKTLVSVVLIISLALAFSAVAFAKEANQTKCPVLGNSVNKNIYTDYNGKRIYFCCPPCVQEFKKNPEKYMKQFEKEGVVLEDAPQAKTK
jgi:YHS domain-containing protein